MRCQGRYCAQERKSGASHGPDRESYEHDEPLTLHSYGSVYAAHDDAGAFGAAISSLLADPDEARRRGLALRRRVEAGHSWRATADGLEAVYRDAVGGRGRACE